MERRPREIYPDISSVYEQNHDLQLELMGRINSLLASNYRTNRPREWEHIGQQEEVIALLRSVAELLNA